MLDKKQIFLDTVRDLSCDLLYYDRKEDEELSREDVEELIEGEHVTADEIVEVFRFQLIKDIRRHFHVSGSAEQ